MHIKNYTVHTNIVNEIVSTTRSIVDTLRNVIVMVKRAPTHSPNGLHAVNIRETTTCDHNNHKKYTKYCTFTHRI